VEGWFIHKGRRAAALSEVLRNIKLNIRIEFLKEYERNNFKYL